MRHLALALVAILIAGLGLFAPAAAPQASAAAPVNPKVAIIVGATHGVTSTYRAYADQLYAEAIKYSTNVVKVYSPNATWSAVKTAVNGASVIIYLGHGNGWPSPYTYDAKYTTKDGFGLNATAGAGDSNTTYYGEPSIRTLTPAPNAVVLLFHLCYASGNSEPGYPDPTLSVAKQRVDNYGAGFLAMGAKAVIADGHSHSPYYVSALFSTKQTIDSLWRGAPSFHDHVQTYASSRTPGMTYQMDPDSASGGYYRSVIGDMDLTTEAVTGANYADTSADPSDFVVPGRASVATDNAPIYPTPETAADTAGEAASLPADTRVSIEAEAGTSPDESPLFRVQTLDGSTSGYMAGSALVPRDSTAPRVWSVDDGAGIITPNGDGDTDTLQLDITLSETAAWTLKIQNGSGKTLAQASGTGSTASLTWNGKVGGTVQPDGTYTWRLTATDGWGNGPLSASATFPLDHDVVLVSRIAGADRFATAAAISASVFAPGASIAYVANGLNFPDALAGAAAAGYQGVPLLLTSRDGIPAATAAELTRLKPARIVVLGGTGMVSDATAGALAAYTDGAVSRIAGADRFATAAAISASVFAPGASIAYVANGLNFPDALAGAAAAGYQGVPLLLTSRDGIPAATAAELTRLKPARIVVLGGTGMVSDATATALSLR